MKALLSVGPLVLVGIVMAYINYRTGGIDLVKTGFTTGLKFLGSFIFLILALAILSGQVQAFYSKKPELLKETLEGQRGIVKASVIGALMPGGLSAGPALQKEWNNGGNKYAIIAFILSTTLINWNTLLIRIPFFGAKITSILLLIGVSIIGLMIGVMSLLKK